MLTKRELMMHDIKNIVNKVFVIFKKKSEKHKMFITKQFIG